MIGSQRKPDPVQCNNCGFLAVRDIDTLELITPSVLYRSEGDSGMGNLESRSPVPHCFVRSHSIHNERMEVDGRVVIEMVGEAPGPFRIGPDEYDDEGVTPTEKAILSVITRDRLCGQFYLWQDGFSPREHHQMREIDRSQEREDQQKRADRWWRLFELLAFIVAGAATGVATAVITALVQKGALFGSSQPPVP